MLARPVVPEDDGTISRIYNQGIEERIATFETRARTAEEVRPWFGGRHPVVVVEEDNGKVAFAATSDYQPRGCYAGIAEFSVYADREARGRDGDGALVLATERAGLWKLGSRVFVENAPSRKLLLSAGFRESGSTRSTPASTVPGRMS